MQYVPGENSIDVRNQLKQGRIDAAVQGSETLPYAQAQEAGKYRVVGEPLSTGYQGIMFRKDDAALRERCTAALRKLGLPVDLKAQPLAQAVELIGRDKKRAGARLRFVVARAAGDVGFTDIDVPELRNHVTALLT